MSSSKKTIEERLAEMEKKEQATRDKAKQYAARRKALQNQQEANERKRRTHILCQVGGVVESVLGRPLDEEDPELLLAFLQDQEERGRFFSKAMLTEKVTNSETRW